MYEYKMTKQEKTRERRNMVEDVEWRIKSKK